MNSTQALIHLDGVTKVFFTDEIETHALAGVHLEIKVGEFLAIAGPPAAGSPRYSLSWVCLTRRRMALTS